MTENIVFAKLVTGEMVLAEKDEAADKIKKTFALFRLCQRSQALCK